MVKLKLQVDHLPLPFLSNEVQAIFLSEINNKKKYMVLHMVLQFPKLM